MNLLSSRSLRGILALIPLSLLFAPGCKEDDKAKVEPTARPAQKEDTANKAEADPIVKTDKATADLDTDKVPLPVVKADKAPGQRVATGDKAPDFELLSSQGGTLALKTLLKESPVALVFYRSAVW